MKKQFAIMFCLLAMFTCLVGCSTGSKASFPETFIGSVGQGKTDALKTLGTTEQALSDYTVDVYGKTADVQLSFDAYRGDETSAGKLNYAELTVPCTPNDDGFSYMRTCYDELEKALGGPFTTDVNMDGVSAEDDTDTLFAALQKMQAAKMSAPYNTSGAVSVKTSRCFTLLLSERKRLGARKAHVFAERACTNFIKLCKKARKF